MVPASYDFKFIPKKNRLIYTLSGDVDYDALITITRALHSDPEYSPELNGILDFTNCNLILSFDEMSRFVEWLSTNENRLRGYVAFVAKSPLTYGTTRMYAGLGDDLQDEIRYFDSIEEAAQWLEEMGKTQ